MESSRENVFSISIFWETTICCFGFWFMFHQIIGITHNYCMIQTTDNRYAGTKKETRFEWRKLKFLHAHKCFKICMQRLLFDKYSKSFHIIYVFYLSCMHKIIFRLKRHHQAQLLWVMRNQFCVRNEMDVFWLIQNWILVGIYEVIGGKKHPTHSLITQVL